MKDMRSYLAELEARFPEEIKHVTRQVDGGAYEASALLEALDRQGKYPAVLFENLVDLNKQATDFRLMLNAHSSVRSMAFSLGSEDTSRLGTMTTFNKNAAEPKPVIRIDEGAPVKEVVWVGDDLDLNRLPIPRMNEMDGGPYLTPTIVARDPENDRYNLSWNRAMFIDKNHLGLWMSPRHLWSMFSRAENRGENLPIAIVAGHHPAFCLAGAGLTKLDKDEYEVAGGVMGESIRVTPSTCYGDKLLIPADAEIVIEGEIVADRRSVEGPFGEFTQYTGPQRLSWLVEVKAIDARKDGIILNIFGGHQENLYAHMPIQADVFASLKAIVPNVIDINWVESGGPLNLIIKLDKKAEGEPLRAAMAAMSLSNFIKHVIVVDKDIDIDNLKEVMWALSTRVQADRDVNILKNIQGQVLDPSIMTEISGSGMVIDATKPSGVPFATKAQPPEEIVRRIRIEDYIQE